MFLELEVIEGYGTNEYEYILMKNIYINENLVTSVTSLCRL